MGAFSLEFLTDDIEISEKADLGMKIGDTVKITGPDLNHFGVGIIVNKASTTKPNDKFITKWRVLTEGELRVYNEIFLEVIGEKR